MYSFFLISDLFNNRAFSLVWHQEATIKNECLNAFSNVYLTDGAIVGEAQALSAEEMTSNLIQLTGRCEESEVTSLEQIVAELFQSDRFRSWRDEILECLWDRIGKESAARGAEYQRLSQTPGSQRNDFSATNTLLGAVIRTVAMIAKFSLNSLSAEKVNLLTLTASHEHVFKELDFFTLRSTCICLQATAPYVYFPNKKDAHLAYNEKSHPALQKALLGTAPFLRDILLGSFCRDNEAITS